MINFLKYNGKRTLRRTIYEQDNSFGKMLTRSSGAMLSGDITLKYRTPCQRVTSLDDTPKQIPLG